MIEYKLSPSILAADFANLGRDVMSVAKAGARYIHLDVMDGMFVPNISFGISVIEGIRKCTDHFFDVHLMVQEPIRHIDKFADAGADGITVHLEACSDILKTINKIKERGVKAAISIRPETPIEAIEYLLDKVYMVLIMSVDPGYGGQKFLESSCDKITKLRTLARKQNPDLDIEVDGGIRLSNVDKVLKAGANIIVAGTGIFRGDIDQNVKAFHEIFQKYDAV